MARLGPVWALLWMDRQGAAMLLLQKCESVSCSVMRPMGCSPPGSYVHGILQASILEWGVGSHFLLQGIFLTQGSNLGLLLCRWILYHLSHQGSPLQSKPPANALKRPAIFGHVICTQSWILNTNGHITTQPHLLVLRPRGFSWLGRSWLLGKFVISG